MSRILVAYFSASGTTKQVGDRLALGIGADIFEIRPEKPYTEADLRWTNPLARCNREKMGRKDIPIARRIENIEKYVSATSQGTYYPSQTMSKYISVPLRNIHWGE